VRMLSSIAQPASRAGGTAPTQEASNAQVLERRIGDLMRVPCRLTDKHVEWILNHQRENDLRFGESAIELLEPLSAQSPIAKFLDRRGPGIHHLCLATSDVRGDDERLRGAGFGTLRPQPTRGAGGCWVQFVHPKSAGGVLLELSQEDRAGGGPESETE